MFKKKEESPNEFLILGHFIKYNLYLLAKSVVFSSVFSKVDSVQDAINTTNTVMDGIDLDRKKSSE
jgi:hypothetical protein